MNTDMAWADLIILVMVVLVLVSAFAALLLKNLLGAAVATALSSLGVSVCFAILRAPDVALTEATVGAGLGGLLLALAAKRLGLWRIEAQQEPGNKDAGGTAC
ncbi:MAG: Na(+)/H(+) antiporter subunit B [Coriobacteriia bacterium]